MTQKVAGYVDYEYDNGRDASPEKWHLNMKEVTCKSSESDWNLFERVTFVETQENNNSKYIYHVTKKNGSNDEFHYYFSLDDQGNPEDQVIQVGKNNKTTRKWSEMSEPEMIMAVRALDLWDGNKYNRINDYNELRGEYKHLRQDLN